MNLFFPLFILKTCCFARPDIKQLKMCEYSNLGQYFAKFSISKIDILNDRRKNKTNKLNFFFNLLIF